MTFPAAQTSSPVLVIGRSGQLARALAARGKKAGVDLVFAGRGEVDFARCDLIADVIGEAHPRLVINAAAYTAVDGAESDIEAAMAANHLGPKAIAEACAALHIPLIHISTDYVFGGRGRTPYRVDDPPDPQSVYGRSKLAGERAVCAALGQHFILRTAWVYSEAGSNFLRTMLRLGAEHQTLSVVDDQVGSPTYAGDLADTVLALARLTENLGDAAPWGTYHVTNAGFTTWFGFAQAIFALRQRQGGSVPTLAPITTADFPTAAKRPAYSVLDMSRTRESLGIDMPDWRDGLARCMANLSDTATSQRDIS